MDYTKTKKIILTAVFIGAVIGLIFGLTGCMRYGDGASTGYVYAVDDGMVWDKVWFKPSLESTESDCYLVQEDSEMKNKLKEVSANQQIKIKYKKHFMTASLCPEGTGTDDEIISFEIIEKK